MKNLKKIVLIAGLFLLGAYDSEAQIMVRVRPVRPARVVVRRPVAPSPRHVWVAEDWRYRGGRYVWSGGYWAAPPRGGAVWAPGHWANRPRGYVWVPGHWR
jgi:hypothetical protein